MSVGICFRLSLLNGSGSPWERILERLWPPPWSWDLPKSELIGARQCVRSRFYDLKASREYFRRNLVASEWFPRAFFSFSQWDFLSSRCLHIWYTYQSYMLHLQNAKTYQERTSDMHPEQANPIRILDTHNRISAIDSLEVSCCAFSCGCRGWFSEIRGELVRRT